MTRAQYATWFSYRADTASGQVLACSTTPADPEWQHITALLEATFIGAEPILLAAAEAN